MAMSFDPKAIRKLHVTRLHHWTLSCLLMHRVHMHDTYEAHTLRNASIVKKDNAVNSCTSKPYSSVRWVNHTLIEATEPASFIPNPASITTSSTLASSPVIVKSYSTNKIAGKVHSEAEVKFLPSADEVHAVVVRSLEVHPDNTARAVQLLVGARLLALTPHIESFDVIVKALCNYYNHKEIGEKLANYVESMMSTVTAAAKATAHNYHATSTNKFEQTEFWESSFAMIERILIHHLLHYTESKEEEQILSSSENASIEFDKIEQTVSSITEWEQLLSLLEAIDAHYMQEFETQWHDTDSTVNNAHFFSLWEKVFDALWEFVKYCDTVEQSTEHEKINVISNEGVCVNKARSISSSSSSFASCTAVNIIARATNVLCNLLKSFCTRSNMPNCAREVITGNIKGNTSSENSTITKEKMESKQSCQMEDLRRRLTSVWTFLESQLELLQQQISLTHSKTENAHSLNVPLQTYVQSFCSNTLTMLCELISTAASYLYKEEETLHDMHLLAMVQVFQSSFSFLQQLEQTAKQVSTLLDENVCDEMHCKTNQYVAIDANHDYNKNNHHYYQYSYHKEFRNAWLFITSKWQEVLLTLELKSNLIKRITNDKNINDITSACNCNMITKFKEKTDTALVNKTDNVDDKIVASTTLCNKTWLHVMQVSDTLINRLTVHYSEIIKAMELWENVRHLRYNSVFISSSVKLSCVKNNNNDISNDINNYQKTVEESFHKTQMRLLRQLHDPQKELPSAITNLSLSTAEPANCYHRMTNGKQWEEQLIIRITTSIARRDLTEGCHCIEEWIGAVREYQQNRYYRQYNSLEKLHGMYEQIQTTFPQNEMETNTMNRLIECNHNLLCHYILLMLQRIICELPWLTGWLYYCRVISSLSCLCNMRYVNGTSHKNDSIGNNVGSIKYKQNIINEELELEQESFVNFDKEANGTFVRKSKETFFVIDDNVEVELNDALVAIFTKMRLESSTSLIDALHMLECTVKFADGNWHVHSAVYDELMHMLFKLNQYNVSVNGTTTLYNTTVCAANRHSVATQFTRAHEEVCLSRVQNITEMLHEQSIKNKITNIEHEYTKFEFKSNEEGALFVSEVPSTQANAKKQESICTQTHFLCLSYNHSNTSSNNNNNKNNVMNEICLPTTKIASHSTLELEEFSELPTLTNEEVNLLATLAPLIAIATPAQLELYKSQYFNHVRTLQPQPNNSSIHSVSPSALVHNEESNPSIEHALQKSVCRIRAVDLKPLLIKYRKPILWRIHSQTMPTPGEYEHEQVCSSDINLAKASAKATAVATWNSKSDYTLINCLAQNERVQLYLITLLHESHITSVDDIFDDAHAEAVRRVAHALQTTLFYGFMTEETAMEVVRRAATAALNLQQIRWPVLLETELAYYTLHHKGRTPLQLQLSSIASSQPRITQSYHHERQSPMTSKDIACYYTVFHNVLLPSLQLTLTQLRMLARYVERIYELKQIHDERLCTLHKNICDVSTRRDKELEEINNYERTMYELCSYIYFDQYHRNDLNLHTKRIASPLIIYVVYNKTYKTLRKLHSQQKAEQEKEEESLLLEKQGKERTQSVYKDNTLEKKLSECVNRYKTNNYTLNNTLSQLAKKIIYLYVKARGLEESRGATCTESPLSERECIIATKAKTATKVWNMKNSFIDIVCTARTKVHDEEQEKLSWEEEENHLPQKQEEWSIAKYTKTLINVMLNSKSISNYHELNLYDNIISEQNVFYSLEMRWLLDNILYHIENSHVVPDSISLMLCEECKRVMSKCANSTIGRETFTSNDRNNNNISSSSDCNVNSFSKNMIPELVKNEMLYSCKESDINACESIIMQDIKYAHAVRVHDITQLLITLCEINAFRYFNPIHLRTLQTLLTVQPAQLKRIPHRKKNIK